MKPSRKDLRVAPLSQRKNLVKRQDFARVLPPVSGFGEWFQSLPDIYGGQDLKLIVKRIVQARQAGRQVAVSLGALSK